VQSGIYIDGIPLFVVRVSVCVTVYVSLCLYGH